MGFIVYQLILFVHPMGRIRVRWKSFRKNLEILCHPICTESAVPAMRKVDVRVSWFVLGSIYVVLFELTADNEQHLARDVLSETARCHKSIQIAQHILNPTEIISHNTSRRCAVSYMCCVMLCCVLHYMSCVILIYYYRRASPCSQVAREVASRSFLAVSHEPGLSFVESRVLVFVLRLCFRLRFINRTIFLSTECRFRGNRSMRIRF